MDPDHVEPRDALFDRADRAIADAVATRAMVRAGLTEAWQKPIARSACRVPHEPAPTADPTTAVLLEPWWSVARALASAQEVMREADVELERGWNDILPSVETPLASLRR